VDVGRRPGHLGRRPQALGPWCPVHCPQSALMQPNAMDQALLKGANAIQVQRRISLLWHWPSDSNRRSWLSELRARDSDLVFGGRGAQRSGGRALPHAPLSKMDQALPWPCALKFTQSFLETEPGDLRGVDLRGVDLRGVDLRGVDQGRVETEPGDRREVKMNSGSHLSGSHIPPV